MNRKNFFKLCSTTILALQALSFFPATSFASTLETVTTGESSENPIETSTPSSSSEESNEDSISSNSNEESTETSVSTEPSEDTTETSTTSESTESTTESSVPKGEHEKTEADSTQDTSKDTVNQNSYTPNDTISTNKSNLNDENLDSTKIPKNITVEKFILEIGEDARELAQKNDLYASVMIAQAILESGSGTSYLSDSPYFNIFGIKGSYNGNSVKLPTMEDLGNGTLYMIDSDFKAYNNYKESLEDYVDLMINGIVGNKEFYKNVWKSNTESYKDATKALTGSYATDIHYDEKLNSLIETYDLQEYDKSKKQSGENNGFTYPVTNFSISSPFGLRGSEFHRGTDFAAASGTPIHASAAGTVVTAAYDPSWGNYVVISHENGMYTLYAHQEHYIVTLGQKVEQDDVIGYVGSTGNSTGSHLHFEVSLDSSLKIDSLIDPLSILP